MDAINISWRGGEHDFCLPIDRLRALQNSTDAGPEELFNRFRLGAWRVDDVIEVLRNGLIGGGMDTKDAGPLVLLLAEQGELLDLKLTAIQVLQHGLLGVEDDPVGEGQGVETSAPENGGSQTSTEMVP